MVEAMADKEHFATAKSLNRWKVLKKWLGEYFVIAGVLGEVIVAATTAVSELKRFNDLDPLNAPINSVTATLRLVVKGVSGSYNVRFWGVFRNPDDESAGFGGMTFFRGWSTSNAVCSLSCSMDDLGFVASGLVGDGRSNDWRGVTLNFHESPWSDIPYAFSSNQVEMAPKAGVFSDVGAVVISLPERLENNVTIVSGVIELKANNSRWKFPVPAQREKWKIITTQITTNAANQVEARVLRIPVIDAQGNNLGVFDGQ